MPDEAIDELFAAPAQEFTGRRDALVKERKAAGDNEGAKALQALRRPTSAAWAVNRLARTHAVELDEWVELGSRLREAHAELLSGGGRDAVRGLTAERLRRLDSLTALAVASLGASGAAHESAIRSTLEAALADAAAAEQVQSGQLSKELDAPSGFGDVTLAAWTPPTPATPARTPAPEPEDDARRRKEAERLARLRDDAVEKRRQANEAARALEQSRDDVTRLEQQLVAARARAVVAARRAHEAERAAAAADERLGEG